MNIDESSQPVADSNENFAGQARQAAPREPSVGRIVMYRLTANDAQAINRRRTTGSSIYERLNQDPPQWPEGAQAHIGNMARADDIVPLLVTRPWHVPGFYTPGTSLLNGQAILDGNDTLWVTSVAEGKEPGQWSWPDLAEQRVEIPTGTLTDRPRPTLMHIDSRTVEEEIDAKGLTAPRVTPAQIEAQIVSNQYFVFPGTTVTVCCLGLRNGYTVVGESACASPENFNEELGRRIAYDNAKQKIWALEGYRLRERLWLQRG